MKIPKATEDCPFIEFRFSNRGKLTLKAVSHWWGGINSGFHCSDGSEGNTCPPKDLERYMAKFKENKIKEIDKEIIALENQKEKFIKKFML